MFDFLRSGILGVGKRDFGPEWTSTVLLLLLLLLLLPLLVIFLPGAAITAVASAAARKTHFFLVRTVSCEFRIKSGTHFECKDP